MNIGQAGCSGLPFFPPAQTDQVAALEPDTEPGTTCMPAETQLKMIDDGWGLAQEKAEKAGQDLTGLLRIARG